VVDYRLNNQRKMFTINHGAIQFHMECDVLADPSLLRKRSPIIDYGGAASLGKSVPR
jgi:hypothetical protein